PARQARPSATPRRFNRSTMKLWVREDECHVVLLRRRSVGAFTFDHGDRASLLQSCCRPGRRHLHFRAMLDIRLIREKPDFVKKQLAKRGSGDEAMIDQLLLINQQWRSGEAKVQEF